MGAVVDAVVLQYVNWNYTYRCNYDCSHCYTRAESYPKELPRESYVDFAKQIVDAGVFAVGFGGGEPLIRRDFVDIVSLLAAADVQTHLTTNGSLLASHRMQALAEAGLSLLTVSIDSPVQAEHDVFRRKPGSFKAACQAVRTAVAAGVRTHITSVLNSTNAHHVSDLGRLGEGLGVDGLSFKWFRPVGNGFGSRKKYELDDVEAESAVKAVANLQQSLSLEVSFFQDREQGCACGSTQLTLRPNGDVSLCPYDGQVAGSLLNTTLEKIWETVASKPVAVYDDGIACMATTSAPSVVPSMATL